MKKPSIWLLVIGVFLALAPLWGMLGTVVAMVNTFNAMQVSSSPPPEELAKNVSIAMSTTAAGVAVCPIGILILVLYAILRSRSNSDEHEEISPTETKKSRTMVLTTAIITILCCLLGLLYNCSSLTSAFSGTFGSADEQPVFYLAFYAMSAVCIVFYLCLIGFSIDLIRGNFRTFVPFIVVLLLEVAYFFSISALWMHPTIGGSVAGATGVANGGLMPQFFILLPLWAPIVLCLAKPKQQYEESS